MCGICGVYQYRDGEVADETVLRQMLQVVQHRGPDDEGIYIEQTLALGMRRLSIIDLPGGKQPIFNEDGSVVIVFNGEIYNYRELAKDLRRRGHTLRTASDTEVIVHLYEEYGQACVHQLRGMFAFAIWDRYHQQLFIARDRLGIKPVYYTQVGERLIFGSEIKSILQHPNVEVRLNTEALGYFLSLKYVPAPQTMFAGILSLPPGHLLVYNANGVSVRPYWDLSFAPKTDDKLSEAAYAEQLEEILRESVRLRLRSDVPFGAFLSGGIDSSTIVALMAQFLNEPVRTFSVGFESRDGRADELYYARLIAQQFRTEHHEVVVSAQDFIDHAEIVVWHLDQPIADQATIATYMLSKLAARSVKMVLTGEGGDELFAGYARYAGERLSPFFRCIPGFAKALTIALSNRLPGLRRSKIALYALCQSDETARFSSWFPLFNEDMKAALVSESLKHEVNGTSAVQVFAQYLALTDAREPINRMLYTDTKLWLPDFLLLRGDKLTMAASVEARVPLLDHKLVEFAATLPPHLKLNRLTRKYLLKRVSRRQIPAEIVDRKKEGFPLPISSWFRQEARSFIRDVLTPDSIRQRGLFDLQYVEKLINEHETGFANHGILLWGLVNVELWHRLFIDQTISGRIRTAPKHYASDTINRKNRSDEH